MKKNNSRVSQQKAKRQNKKKKKAFPPQRGIINKLVSDNRDIDTNDRND